MMEGYNITFLFSIYVWFCTDATQISHFLQYSCRSSSCALFRGSFTQTFKLFMVTTFIKKKKKGHSLNLISHGHSPPRYLYRAAGLPLSGPWYWQGWHQRRALTLGELGLPAVSNQVYFEVRDTWTPRAKAATSPTPQPPQPSLQPPSPPGTTDT